MNEFKHFGETIRIRGGNIDSIECSNDIPDIIVNVTPEKPRFVTGYTGCAGLSADTYYFDNDPHTFSWGGTFKVRNYGIKKILLNPKKNATTVLWEDGTATIVKRSEGDEPADIWSVVSYALAEKVYGSNSAFKREIKGKVERIKKG